MVRFIATALVALFAVQSVQAGPIVGGTEAPANKFPWMVTLLNNGRHWCGGFLVKNNVVMTAAHCMGSISQVGIKGGSTTTSGTDRYDVETYKSHPSFSSVTGGYDVALMKIRPRGSTLPSVTPVAYDRSSTSTSQYDGRLAKVIGWGRLSNGGSSPTNLMQVDLRIASNQNCQISSSQLTSTMLCANPPTGPESGCYGDSGGPFFLENPELVVGTVSWGRGCRGSTIFGRINSVTNWIDQVMAEFGGSTPPPTPTGGGCTDATVNGGQPWHDSDGPQYNCEWYAVGNRCAQYGHLYRNFNLVANEACCVCKSSDPAVVAALKSPYPDPGCQCDGGVGPYDQCRAGVFSDLPDTQGACILSSRYGKSQKPRCQVPPNMTLGFSDNYQRWYIKGCTVMERGNRDQIMEHNSVPLVSEPTESQVPTSTSSVGFAGMVAGAAAGSAFITAGVAMVIAKRRRAVKQVDEFEDYRIRSGIQE